MHKRDFSASGPLKSMKRNLIDGAARRTTYTSQLYLETNRYASARGMTACLRSSVAF